MIRVAVDLPSQDLEIPSVGDVPPLGASKLGDGGVTLRDAAELSRDFKPVTCSSAA